MSAWGLDWVCGGCSIKHLVSHTVFVASKSRENRRKQSHFCQRNSAPLFAYTPTHFGKIKKSHPHLRFVWFTLPRSGTFVSNDDFLDHHRPEEKETARRPTTKKCGSPLHRSPCFGSCDRQSGLPLFLFDFEVFEDFLHCFLGGCHQHCFDESHCFLF